MWILTHPTLRRRLLLAAAVGLALPGAGRAFYFDYGPGSGRTPAPSLIPMAVPTAFANPPSALPPGPNDWSWPPTDTPNGPTGGPTDQHAPEPATGLAAMIGLAAVAIGRRIRRK